MSYIFMKFLERKPEGYDAGLRRISGQDWGAIRARIIAEIKPGEKVLELGCGPGTLAIELDQKGAQVTALDRSRELLIFARGQAMEAGAAIGFRHLDLERLNELEGQWDWVIASLTFSELRPMVRKAVLIRARKLLRERGRILVVDEVVPENFLRKIRYHLVRSFLGLVTYFRTRKSTAPLEGFNQDLAGAGYQVLREEELSSGGLKLWIAQILPEAPLPEPGELKAGWGSGDWLDSFFLWLTSHLLKIPFLPGLYRIGNPGAESPLLTTANYRLTVNLVRKYLKGFNVWLLVNDTRGVNVWCSAGERNFSASEIAITLAASQADRLIQRRELILPKLCLNGVRLGEVKARSGFVARIGPVYAKDLPAYLSAGGELGAGMDRIRFNFQNRLWFGVPFAVFMSLITGVLALALPWLIRKDLPLWFGMTSLLIAATYTWLPTRRHLVKGLVLGAGMALAVALYQFSHQAVGWDLARNSILLIALGLFVTADFSGVTPVSNRTLVEKEFKAIYLTLIGLLLVYFVFPKIVEVFK